MHQLTRYLQKMRGVLYRRGGRREEIEDLMQDAFVRLLEYCEKGAEVREPEAVLVRTVVRLSINRERDSHHDMYVRESIENLVLIDPGPIPEEILVADQCLEGMQRTLDSISRRTRRIFFLHRLQGLSYAQIGRETGLSVRTVEKHIARAMTVLLEKRRREMAAL
jgi:RNA polymerase sigma factor (sigma-70 family)